MLKGLLLLVDEPRFNERDLKPQSTPKPGVRHTFLDAALNPLGAEPEVIRDFLSGQPAFQLRLVSEPALIEAVNRGAHDAPPSANSRRIDQVINVSTLRRSLPNLNAACSAISFMPAATFMSY
jgi:hypothetical protein